MEQKFSKHIDEHLDFLKEGKLLLAISGGLDSVVLAHLCYDLKLNVALAHCNFNLRGEESDADEAFVLDLAEQFNFEVFIESFDTEAYAETHQLSIQMAARQLRYDWFHQLSEHLGFDFILTAHHADDNLETFLINLTRGTGFNGLTGIPEINHRLVRPLLIFSRSDIEDYAERHRLQWREDSSNASDKYLRNNIRHHVVPTLKEGRQEFLQNFKNTLSNLNDIADIVADRMLEFESKAIESIDENQVKFKISEFKTVNNPRAYLYELFKDYGFTEWNDVMYLLEANSGKFVMSKTHRLIKDRDHLILTALKKPVFDAVEIQDNDTKVPISKGILFFDEADAVTTTNKNTIYVDKNKLVFPLLLRHWEHGDSFYPFGMRGKKKLSKYFKDEKYTLVEKENAVVLTSGDHIVWLVGERADDRFKVSEHTSQILKITLETNES
ncbi:tRNA lysidine(34) synthetase TilS [Psychroserpens sp. BH13MA-6]